MTPLPGLAPRTVRLAAAFLDTLLALPLLIIWLMSAAGSIGVSLGALSGHLKERPWVSQAGTLLAGGAAWVVLAASSVAVACLVLYQWYLLSTRGQTIGKRVMGIRIVDLDGKPVGFFSALLLRSWVFSSVVSAAVTFTSALIPFAGLVLWLVDYLPLFGEDRRCLHDYLAGTQVRWVRVVEVYVGRIIAAVAGATLVGATVAAVLNREALMELAKNPPQLAAVAPTPPTPPTPPPAPLQVPIEVKVPEPVAVVAPAPVEKKVYQFTDEQGVSARDRRPEHGAREVPRAPASLSLRESVEEGPSTSLGLNGFDRFRSRRAESRRLQRRANSRLEAVTPAAASSLPR